jgi:soluble lytic murein transglycosylase-like protein
MKMMCVVLLAFLALLPPAVLLAFHQQVDVYAANQQANGACSWYRVRPGDTLNYIAGAYRTNSWALARVNHIININLIFVGQLLCISGAEQTWVPETSSGILQNGSVRWYDYYALDHASKGEVGRLLRHTARMYGLPANLVLAIAWQESGWTQDVISRDGGIGAMQVMPYTATVLNAQTRIRRDPYKLMGNIELGTTYLYTLWRAFHGDLISVISAYNEGGWNVMHRGIFNWRYIDSVLTLMRRF